MTRRHLPVMVVMAVVLVGLALIDVGDPAPKRFGTATAFAMPTADADSSLSSTWFCAAGAGAAAQGSESAGGVVVMVANSGDEARSGTVTWFPADAPPVSRPVQVEAHSGVALDADDVVDAGPVSAMIELDGGAVGVEHVVSDAAGASVAPCASSASDRWYLANGTTARDATQVLSLFNPFSDDAIVDITFATDQGRDEPEALQGLPVAAGTTLRINVGDVVRRRDVTATSVIARRGRLVVDRLQRFDPSDGRSGISLSLATPAPAEVWDFPAGQYQEGLTERWHIYNPGDQDAVVLLEVVPDSGVVPFGLERTVSAGSQLVIDAAETAQVPPGVGHWSSVRSINGVGVVAERELSGVAPSPRRGWSSMLGAPATSGGWLLASGAGAGAVADRLTVYNPGGEIRRFSVWALDDGQRRGVPGLVDVELEPVRRQEVSLAEVLDDSPLPLVVTADGPIVVERDLSPAVDPGISTTLGIPLS